MVKKVLVVVLDDGDVVVPRANKVNLVQLDDLVLMELPVNLVRGDLVVLLVNAVDLVRLVKLVEPVFLVVAVFPPWAVGRGPQICPRPAAGGGQAGALAGA